MRKASTRALAAIARFRQLARDMGLKTVHTVATAAVREASNGPAFLKQVAALGLKPRIVPGDEEAALSGLGVLSAIPEARGVVADLGGGSLELVQVGGGDLGKGVSLPLGVLRVGEQPSRKAIASAIRKGVKGTALDASLKAMSLYLVGGSFRALARLDLHETDHPLPIVHGHRLDAGAGRRRWSGSSPTTPPVELKARTRAELEPAWRAAGGDGDPRCDVRRVRAGRGGGVVVRASRGAVVPRSRPRDAGAGSADRRRAGGGRPARAGSAIMARRSMRGSTRCFPTTIRRRAGFGWRRA